MFYFKFTDMEGNEMYAEIDADMERIDLLKVKDLLHAETLVEVSKEEYDEQTEDDE